MAGATRRNSASSLNPTPAPSQPPLRKVSFTPEDDYKDDYTYHDAGPSISLTNPKQHSGGSSSIDASDDRLDPDELNTNIFEKELSGTRAKVPDWPSGFDRPNGNPALPQRRPTAHAQAPTATPIPPDPPSKRRKRRFLSTPNSSIAAQVPRSAERTILRKVELHWSRKEIDGVEKVSLNARASNNNASTDPENSVLWQHSNYENIQLKELEDLVRNLQIHGLQRSEIRLTKRLVNRVRLVSERSFVHGSFLNPTSIRYDMLDDSIYNKDKCSIFLGFPYFAVKKPDEKLSAFSKGAPEHPTRTLLQSRYRLNKTTKRDESQCITELNGDQLLSCIKALPQATAHLTHKMVEEIIYVPQLWTLIIGLDRMITAGPIEDVALKGWNLTLEDAGASRAISQCSFVRISFKNRGVVESQIYPINQCSSWFGLLNIHQQLRSVLKSGKEKAAPKDFKLRCGTHTLTGSTWASVQQSSDTEILAIWMDTPEIPAISVQDADSYPSTEQEGAQNSATESLHETTRAVTGTNTTYPKLDPIPFRPFLEWRVLDDFGNRDESTPEVKVDRFLSAIYRSLTAECASPSTAAAPQAAQTLQTRQDSISVHAALTGQTTAGRQDPQLGQRPPIEQSSQPNQTPQAAQMRVTQADGTGRQIIKVIGRTSRDVDDLTYRLKQQADGNETMMQLRKETVKLLSYYLPTIHNELLDPVRIFWGLVYELIEHRQRLQLLCEKIQDINIWTKRLHIGVYCHPRTVDNAGAVDSKSTVSDHAILQATMIDALGAVFHMLVAAVTESRSGSSNDPAVKPWRKALRHGEEASKLLEKARDTLIAEATSSASGRDLGPVITPEPILIMLLERLAHGVYGSGTVDVINVFEECLEQLALDVEQRPSRRLLKRINAFQEEVDIVNSVMQQQQKVLIQFRTCLDPAEFKRPTTARKMRFKFEKIRIERVLTHIRDQRRYCKELCDRAKVLEDQNVRLVETLADDNSRAIFIFTFITILFLPLSFVATFFGMNVVGINPTKSTTKHFWVVGAPLTGGIFVICLIFVFRGEDVWFLLADLPARLRRRKVVA